MAVEGGVKAASFHPLFSVPPLVAYTARSMAVEGGRSIMYVRT